MCLGTHGKGVSLFCFYDNVAFKWRPRRFSLASPGTATLKRVVVVVFTVGKLLLAYFHVDRVRAPNDDGHLRLIYRGRRRFRVRQARLPRIADGFRLRRVHADFRCVATIFQSFPRAIASYDFVPANTVRRYVDVRTYARASLVVYTRV